MKVFGKLENELIELCHQCPPDLKAIQAKIAEGADINAHDGEQYAKSSLLAEVICNFGYSELPQNVQPYSCEYLPAVIKIFLDAGFDVQLDEGRYGAMALGDLIFCYTDKYIFDAATLLLDAGADPTIIPYEDDPSESVLEMIRFDAWFRSTEGDKEESALLYELADLIESRMK